MHSILIVDDEISIRESFSLIFTDKYKVLLAASGEVALKIIADQKVDLIYLDIRMPGINGLETLKRIKKMDPDQEIVMVTAVNEVQKASEAIKHGARDYVVKPFDIDHITNLTEQILRRKSILLQKSLIQENARNNNIPELIGQADKIVEISKAVHENKRVLILGEAGTEKEHIAQIIHNKSKRAPFPYKSAHLSADMTAEEIKSLFFGWEKGRSAFDLEAKSGIFEQAKDGTLFINNLEYLPQDIFKCITSQNFSRKGSSTNIPIQTRIISSGPPDLEAKNKNIFVFFSEILIQIPPLRERSSDIPLLANHFAQKYNARYGKNVEIHLSTMEALTNYSWPGNTKQLENLIARLILTCFTNKILPEDLPLDILVESKTSAGSEFLSSFEKEFIKKIFINSGKNKERAAARLGVSPMVLETKI